MNKFFATLAAFAIFCSFLLSGQAAQATPSDAITCSAGRYSATGYSSVTENVICAPAPAGTYVGAPGATEPTPCPAGTFREDTGGANCPFVFPGTYSLAGAITPTRCDAGTYASAFGASACDPARAGYYVPDGGAVIDLACPPGKYQPMTGQILCLDAPTGSYVPALRAVAATPCELGSYAPITGSIACQLAPVGTYVSSTGAVSTSNCPADRTTATTGSTSVDACSISTASAGPTKPPTSSKPSTPVVTLKTQSLTSLKLPSTLKVLKTFSFAKFTSSKLAIKAVASGACKISSTSTLYKITASSKIGNCILKISNAGNSAYLPLSKTQTIKIIR